MIFIIKKNNYKKMGCFQVKPEFKLTPYAINIILAISGSKKNLTDIKTEYLKPKDEQEYNKLQIMTKQFYFVNSSIDRNQIEKIYRNYQLKEYKNPNLKIGAGWTSYNQTILREAFELCDYELNNTYFKTTDNIIWYLNEIDPQNILIYKFEIKPYYFEKFKNGFKVAHNYFVKQ